MRRTKTRKPEVKGGQADKHRDRLFVRGQARRDEATHPGAGVHLVIGAQGIGFGGGHYGLEPEALECYRQAVSELFQRAARVGADLDPPELARAPKGHAPAPWDDLIRRKSVIFRSREELAYPDWLLGLEAVEGWRQIISALAPASHWLARLL